MKVIVRFRKKGGGYEYVQARKPKAEGRELVVTSNEAEAKIWNTLYAATDFISKSGSRLGGVEIIQLDDKGEKSKSKDNGSKEKVDA